VTVRKGSKRGPARHVVIVAACLVLLAGPTGAAAEGPDGRIVLDGSLGARAAEPLLARLWASGFFRRNEAVLRELLNNDYALFDASAPKPPDGVRGLACFSKKSGRKDTIFLRKDLFAHFDVGLEGTVEHADVGGRVLPVLVHEIFHDLWLNVLDEQERAAFSREGEAFMKDFRMAQTAEDKRLFLLLAGDDSADPRCLRSYAGIGDILAANPTRALCGHEMFAWLAERLFTTRAMIPCPLRKYYSCVLAGIPSATAGTK
jgi:hypothetical protein